ncbi:hypothetical protein Tcan_11508 [Toxocara canis]|uniref:Uncharacterized protein n=1 Tax=Toxocara canis TaxID=6265 RepID=A0A0B2V8M8_TOXCA|nr:hypothetical protein Tcan_11508 [Toxocara canis]
MPELLSLSAIWPLCYSIYFMETHCSEKEAFSTSAITFLLLALCFHAILHQTGSYDILTNCLSMPDMFPCDIASDQHDILTNCLSLLDMFPRDIASDTYFDQLLVTAEQFFIPAKQREPFRSSNVQSVEHVSNSFRGGMNSTNMKWIKR